MAFLSRRTLPYTTAIAMLAFGAALAAQRDIAQRHVYVGVTDAKGAAVTTLTPADLVVREDDIAREIVRVGAAPPPTHLALLVDNTAELQKLLTELRGSLTAVAQQMHQLPSPPAMMLTSFAERPTRLVDFTTSDIAIENGVKKLFPRPGGGFVFPRRHRGDDRGLSPRQGGAAGDSGVRHGLEPGVQRSHSPQHRGSARSREDVPLDDPAPAHAGRPRKRGGP